MSNTWLTANARPLAQLKQFLTECEYKPEFDNFPLRPLQKVLNGAEAEVRRLHSECETLKAEVKRLNALSKPVPPPDPPETTGV